jgi:hypothetical protein
MIKHAFESAALGLPIFAVRPGDKRPLHTGWQAEATTNPDALEQLWAAAPTANVGVATGHGTLVIDIDTKHGDGYEVLRALEAQHGALPPTLRVETPSGGQHIYLRIPDGTECRNTAGKLGANVDTRGDGGYVVGPGSKTPDGSYRVTTDAPIADCPPWVLALLRPPAPKRAAATAPRAPACGSKYGKAALERECRAVASAAEGTRNATLNRAALALGQLAAGGELLQADAESELLSAAHECGLPEQEARATITSGMTAGAREPRSAPPPQPRAAPAPQQAPAQGWQESLHLNADGTVTKEPGNAALWLAHLPEWEGTLAHNDLTDQVFWAERPPALSGLACPRKGDDIRDADLTYIGAWFARRMRVAFSSQSIAAAVQSAALNLRVNPMRDYYQSLEWDGQPRLATWLSAYLGAEQSDYSAAVGTWWLISVVARALEPGCQADHMLVLEGPQAAGKSRAMRILGGKWFLGTLPDIRDKDAAQVIRGKGICEIAELDAIRGAAITRIKDFLTQQIDTYRPSYGRFTVTRPRTSVFVGSTNEQHYLHDPTGARRFWPVRCQGIDLASLARDRDQLFAEAVKLRSDGHAWWPQDQSIIEEITEQQDERAATDDWAEPVLSWLADHPRSTTAEIAVGALRLEISKVDRYTSTRIGSILRKHSAIVERVRRSGAKERLYSDPGPTSIQ